MKHIVGFSGGVDSQATARWVLNRFDPKDVILTNTNAGGNEHPYTETWIAEYSQRVHPVVVVQPVMADMWETPGYAERRGYSSGDPLTFERLIEVKGRPPSRKAQFCTMYLKLIPQRRWIRQAFGPGGQFEGEEFERYTGVRRDESDARKNAAFREWDNYYDCWLNAPIADWTKQMAFDFLKAHGEEVNPLYLLGFNRVGCAPCINSGKDDILKWHQRFPEMLDKIRGWEASTKRTFFHPMVPGMVTNNVDDVIRWAHTDHGGRQVNMLTVIHTRPSCESKYGLCE